MIGPCQRWREGRTSYRPVGEPIDPRSYGVEVLLERDAKPFVVRHHYEHSFPSARLRVGLFRSRGRVWAPELVGVAVFSVPMSQKVFPKHLGTSRGVELGRLVLLDDVPANAETWFLARAFPAVRAELCDVDGILSFSDPVERRSVDGELVKPGHVGVIYQAFGGRYLGRANPKTMWLAPDGRVVPPVDLRKVRRDEKGRDYSERTLVALGAPPRRLHEDGRAWAARCLVEAPWRRVRHPGNHTYAWPLTKALKVEAVGPAPCSYCGMAHRRRAT